MNAKEYLSQAYLVEQRIRSKIQQIEALRSTAEGLNHCIESEPVAHTRNVTALQDTVGKIVDVEHELDEEIDRLVDLKREIARNISLIGNVIYRLILEKRHLSYLKWDQIAEDLEHTDRWAQYQYKAALREMQRLLDSRYPEDE